MLREVPETRQIPGEPSRRWFADADMDLIVWLSPAGQPHSFQLCYPVGHAMKALTWTPEKGYTHRKVDTGEEHAVTHKMTPILVLDGVFDGPTVSRLFAQRADDIEPDVRDWVLAKLSAYPGVVARP